MDTLQKINSIEDADLQALLSHATRYALQHNVIAAQAEKQTKDPKVANQATQAVIIHKDTANLLSLLVAHILKDVPDAEEPTNTGKAMAKRKAK